MPEWLAHLITALVTGGGVAAIFKGYVSVLRTRYQHEIDGHARERQNRGDEVDVLQRAINELRGDRDELKKELAEARAYFDERSHARDKELNDLKSDSTATLLDLERCRVRDKYLTDQNRSLNQRVGQLEKEVAELEKEVRGHAGGPGQ